MNPLYLLAPLAGTVFFLIRAELKKNFNQVYIFKPVSTLLVIAAALFAITRAGAPLNGRLPGGLPLYFFLGIVIGLVLSLGGDICLMFYGNERAFTIGLALFLLAQISYAAVFTAFGIFRYIDFISAGTHAAIGILTYRKMLPGLGSMKLPVLVYLVIISFMVNRAVAFIGFSGIGRAAAVFLAAGSFLFFLSDWILAYDKFVKQLAKARMSVAFYYAGQFLIALSLSYIR